MPPPECHLKARVPCPWIVRFAPLLPVRARVLDVACGGGRHARYFLEQGAALTCVDKDVSFVGDLVGQAEIVEIDLESGPPWPFAGRTFDAVVVVNYLFRPLIPFLIDAVADRGLFLYETYAAGNERYSRPSNPDHLLRPGELLDAVAGRFQVVAYEAGIEQRPLGLRVIERICAVRSAEPILLPPQHPS
jgi:SAM-dependent methyltransferase